MRERERMYIIFCFNALIYSPHNVLLTSSLKLNTLSFSKHGHKLKSQVLFFIILHLLHVKIFLIKTQNECLNGRINRS